MRLKFPQNLCRDQKILWDPSNPKYKNRNKSKNAFVQIDKVSVWSAWPEAPTLFIFRTEVTEDNFMR